MQVHIALNASHTYQTELNNCYIKKRFATFANARQQKWHVRIWNITQSECP